MGESKTNAIMTKKATIHVTTKAGATVVFKRNSTTYSTQTANASGVADLTVMYADWSGTWTVDVSWAVSGNGNAVGSSGSITISAATTYNVSVSLRLWLVKDGNFVSGVSHTYTSDYSASASFDDEGSYVNLHQGATRPDHWDANTGYLGSAITFDGYWKSLVFETRERGYGATGASPIVGLTNGSGSFPTFQYYAQLRGAGEYSGYNSKHTSTINVSSVSGSYKVAARVAMYDYYNWAQALVYGDGDLNIYNAYLDS